MNWLGLIFGIIIVGVIVYLWSRNKNKDLGGRTLIMFGFAKIGYNINQMDLDEADRLAIKLRKVAVRAWDALQRVYGDEAQFGIEHIIFDPEFEETSSDGGRIILRKVIRLLMPERMITMRPQGDDKHPPEYWFALEMHNLYRGIVYGTKKIYLDDNPSDEELRLWNSAQDACKDAVR